MSTEATPIASGDRITNLDTVRGVATHAQASSTAVATGTGGGARAASPTRAAPTITAARRKREVVQTGECGAPRDGDARKAEHGSSR